MTTLNAIHARFIYPVANSLDKYLEEKQNIGLIHKGATYANPVLKNGQFSIVVEQVSRRIWTEILKREIEKFVTILDCRTYSMHSNTLVTVIIDVETNEYSR